MVEPVGNIDHRLPTTGNRFAPAQDVADSLSGLTRTALVGAPSPLP